MKYGFIYLWYDRKHKRYYLGSHWGNPDDGYICSSRWMRKAYRRRPEDFRRRVIDRIYTNRKELFELETRWLLKVKNKSRYYNINFKAWEAITERDRRSVNEKIAVSATGRKHTPETKAKLSALRKGKPTTLGKKMSQETKDKISARHKGRSNPHKGEDSHFKRPEVQAKLRAAWDRRRKK